MPPRKKQKTAHNAHPSEADKTSASQEGDPIGNAGSSPSSVIVPSWKGTKRRHTSLEKFVDGPVDIVVEVLALLHPRDLFTLVRTSSVFKNFLLSKDRRRLWKTVVANAPDLPSQPPWLSEPAFVHLLYSNHCHHCGTVTRQVITEWFTRACSKCISLPEVSITWGNAWHSIRGLGQQRGSDLSKVFDMILNGKQPPHMSPRHMGREQAYRCFTADVNKYLAQLRNIKKNPSQKKREDAYLHVAGEWRQRQKRRQKYAALLNAWFKKEEENRLAELGDKRDQRFAEIVARLQESDWAKEMGFLTPEEIKQMATFPVVRRTSKLTVREWSNVLAALESFLNATRERRLLTEREATVRARLRELEKAMLEHYVQLPRTAAMDVRPSYIEFALMPKCKALADAPVEQTVTRADFLAILPDLHKKWQTTSKSQVAKTVQRLLRTSTISISTRDPLNLAITVFVCKYCAPFACMRYPAVLAHDCGSKKDDWSDEEDEELNSKNLYSRVAKDLHDDEWGLRERFSLGKVIGPQDDYLHQVFGPMCTIVRALGLDPSTATAGDLDACDARLRCARCVAKGKPSEVYSWDAALFHRRSHRVHPKCEWTRVHSTEMDKVRELEAVRDARPLLIHPDWTRWACALCEDWDTSGDKIAAHLSNQHGLSDPDGCVRNGTIYVHPTWNTTLTRPPVSLTPVQGEDSSGLVEASI